MSILHGIILLGKKFPYKQRGEMFEAITELVSEDFPDRVKIRIISANSAELMRFEKCIEASKEKVRRLVTCNNAGNRTIVVRVLGVSRFELAQKQVDRLIEEYRGG